LNALSGVPGRRTGRRASTSGPPARGAGFNAAVALEPGGSVAAVADVTLVSSSPGAPCVSGAPSTR